MKEVSWGCRALDDLAGPITSTLHLVYGPTGSGKTTLAAYMPMCQISKQLIATLGSIPPELKFVIGDGDGGFAMERLEEILQANGIDPAMVKPNIVYNEFTTFDEQHKYITNELEKKVGKEGWRPVLLTLDPAVALYRGIVLRTDMQHRASVIGIYSGKIDLQLATLRRMAVQFGCPALVSSWTASPVSEAFGGSPETPMIGGRATAFLSKVVLEITMPAEGAPEREALLVKHRARAAGSKAKFKLTEKGIEDIEKRE